jgi:hypothetical protein
MGKKPGHIMRQQEIRESKKLKHDLEESLE